MSSLLDWPRLRPSPPWMQWQHAECAATAKQWVHRHDNNLLEMIQLKQNKQTKVISCHENDCSRGGCRSRPPLNRTSLPAATCLMTIFACCKHWGAHSLRRNTWSRSAGTCANSAQHLKAFPFTVFNYSYSLVSFDFTGGEMLSLLRAKIQGRTTLDLTVKRAKNKESNASE